MVVIHLYLFGKVCYLDLSVYLDDIIEIREVIDRKADMAVWEHFFHVDGSLIVIGIFLSYLNVKRTLADLMYFEVF